MTLDPTALDDVHRELSAAVADRSAADARLVETLAELEARTKETASLLEQVERLLAAGMDWVTREGAPDADDTLAAVIGAVAGERGFGIGRRWGS